MIDLSFLYNFFTDLLSLPLFSIMLGSSVIIPLLIFIRGLFDV